MNREIEAERYTYSDGSGGYRLVIESRRSFKLEKQILKMHQEHLEYLKAINDDFRSRNPENILNYDKKLIRELVNSSKLFAANLKVLSKKFRYSGKLGKYGMFLTDKKHLFYLSEISTFDDFHSSVRTEKVLISSTEIINNITETYRVSGQTNFISDWHFQLVLTWYALKYV